MKYTDHKHQVDVNKLLPSKVLITKIHFFLTNDTMLLWWIVAKNGTIQGKNGRWYFHVKTGTTTGKNGTNGITANTSATNKDIN